jgi:hypothetical protein
MSNAALFLLGAAVTALVVTSMALLVWGAILDGRDEQLRRRADLGRATASPLTQFQPIDWKGDAA